MSTESSKAKPTFINNVIQGLKPGSNFADKDAFLDAVYGIKLVLSIIIGTAFGIIPLTGAVGFIVYAIVICGAMLGYAKGLMDDEECQPNEIFTEGLMPCAAIFIVSWSATYSLIQA